MGKSGSRLGGFKNLAWSQNARLLKMRDKVPTEAHTRDHSQKDKLLLRLDHYFTRTHIDFFK